MKKLFLLLIFSLTIISIFASNAFLGVVVDDNIPENLKMRFGVIVLRTVDQAPAEKAGLKSGDVILKVNGMKIVHAEDIGTALKGSQVGDEVKILVLRGEQKIRRLTAVLEPRANFRSRNFIYNNPIHFYLNVNYIVLNPQLKKYFSVQDGVFVTEVFDQENSDFKAGDIIVSVEDIKINGGNDFYDIITKYDISNEIELKFKIERNGKLITKMVGINKRADYYSFDYSSNSINLKRNGRIVREFKPHEIKELIKKLDEKDTKSVISKKIDTLEEELIRLKKELNENSR